MLIFRACDELGQNCEVRSAGNSLRLYTDGTFHSQFNPTKLIEDNLWDLLWLPALLQAQAPLRVLVLGVGGGAVMAKLQRIFPTALLVGVDISALHLHIAKTIFGVKSKHVLLLEADALAFVKQYRGPAFGLIVDDLFTTNNGEPERVTPLNQAWLTSLARRLSDRGQIITNFGSSKEYRQAARVVAARGDFTSLCYFSHKHYENAVGSFSRERVSAQSLSMRTAIEKRLQNFGGGRVPRQIHIKSA
ncbi:hypothetical protein QWI17_11535 [Gilvimarinus sp. SDUM040013]|uniref:Methyltransferase domain-containing protein n=1 Tax=Gilvimarinus gilvus TaxID=3058038 RepID=A0ABU4RXV2_9GAMM|nr:hypothetical protein [Gilvimarinus sp. SDUM040013]MDO3386469.1 hypothetical protein [Gilvimarinus sp. SDUM040013]MDX6849735.1 hypothetical protein [Gilvimarinus sp. SDUM040013]